MSCLCKAGRFSYGESPRTPPLEGNSLHRRNISVERPWGILSLFTTCLPLWVKSSHHSRCHASPTQELKACILRRQSNAGKDGTRKKSASEEHPRKSPEKNFKNEPPEQLTLTQSQRQKGLRTNPKKELSISKQPCKLLRTKPKKTGMSKNQPELKKLTSEQIRALQTAQKTTPQEKSWVEDGSGKEREKVTEKRALHKRKQSY